MKKSENLAATLLAIYAIILTLCIAIYAIFKLLGVDIALATNLLIWSATIFAPVAVLKTYTNWREQRSTEVIADQCKLTLSKVIRSQEEYHCLHNSFMQENRDYGISKKYLENFRIARLEVKQEFSLLKEMVGENSLHHKIKFFDDETKHLQNFYGVLLSQFNKVDRNTKLPDLNDLDPFNIFKKELTEYVLFRK